MGKVVGVGSLILDYTAYVPHFPKDGESALGTNIKIGPGGKGSNQMTAIHRAGIEAVNITAVGDDFSAEILLGHYRKEGMTTKYIRTIPNCPTGSAVIEVDDSGQNRIIVVKGANDRITRDDVYAAEKEFKTADVILTQLETSRASILACKELAKKYNKPFILNPAPFQKIPEGLFDGVDYLTPNETETQFFTGITVNTINDASRAAEKLLKMGVRNVIITLGKGGAFFKNENGEAHVKGIVVDAVDTTGAGDAFNGGLAAALAYGMDIKKALFFANCVGALSVTKMGASPAMPYIAEINNKIVDLKC